MARSKKYSGASLRTSLVGFFIVCVGLMGSLALFRIGPRIWPRAANLAETCQYQNTWDLSGVIGPEVQGMAFLKHGSDSIIAVAAGSFGNDGQLLFYNLTTSSVIGNINPTYNCGEPIPNPERKLNWLYDVTSDGTYFYVYHYDNNHSKYIIARFSYNGVCNNVRELQSGGIGVTEGAAIDGAGDMYVSRFTSSPYYVGVYFSGQSALGLKIGEGQMSDPRGLFVDSAGKNLYIADTEGNSLIHFTETIHHQSWSLQDTILNLAKPRDVALSSTSRIYIAEKPGDTGIHNRILRYDSMGDPSPEYCGSYGSGNGQFNGPTAIAFNPSGNEEFYVVDTTKRVQKFIWPALIPTPTASPTPTVSPTPSPQPTSTPVPCGPGLCIPADQCFAKGGRCITGYHCPIMVNPCCCVPAQVINEGKNTSL
jgi:hypothetical protein